MLQQNEIVAIKFGALKGAAAVVTGTAHRMVFSSPTNGVGLVNCQVYTLTVVDDPSRPANNGKNLSLPIDYLLTLDPDYQASIRNWHNSSTGSAA
jgi:hypothetical protein